MKVKAMYRRDEEVQPGKIIHSVDHDGGGFIVSSEAVGIAVQNFLNAATASDLSTLHSHLLWAFAREQIELENLPEEPIELHGYSKKV